ncbi:hypothetical protein B0T22DRAFT_440711 [Podospora appendiculata]|uniref:Uncharacterized protein n=1 Tax=Podospora appendiculata TaxID=314037 RepID=A0AAE1CD54_9PEZI|nr:hypothetical protein B0T22DRAFT_440711 [Podospora appendiculata]
MDSRILLLLLQIAVYSRYWRVSLWLALVAYSAVVVTVPGILIGAAFLARQGMDSGIEAKIIGAKIMTISITFLIHVFSVLLSVILLRNIQEIWKIQETRKAEEMIQAGETISSTDHSTSILSLGSWATLWSRFSFDQCLLVVYFTCLPGELVLQGYMVRLCWSSGPVQSVNQGTADVYSGRSSPHPLMELHFDGAGARSSLQSEVTRASLEGAMAKD